MSNAVMTVIITLVMSLGANAFIIKYVLPKIQLRIDELEKHKATAITKDEMKEIFRSNNALQVEVFKNLLLELKLELKS